MLFCSTQLPDQTPTAVEALLSVFDSEVEASVVATEKRVIALELEQFVADPAYLLGMNKLFGVRSPFARSAGGDSAVISKMEAETVRDFCDSLIIPERAVLVVAGTFSVGSLSKLVRPLTLISPDTSLNEVKRNQMAQNIVLVTDQYEQTSVLHFFIPTITPHQFADRAT
jgi:predicted Zn-dependent peptidase